MQPKCRGYLLQQPKCRGILILGNAITNETNNNEGTENERKHIKKNERPRKKTACPSRCRRVPSPAGCVSWPYHRLNRVVFHTISGPPSSSTTAVSYNH